jgi:Family of unknown function (DUF5335)
MGAKVEIKSVEWSRWCADTTAGLVGREIVLRFADQGVGEVRLADGKPFVAIEYDELGPAVAFTIKYGDGVLPVRHVVAEPRDVQQQLDADGVVERVTIEDSTGRRTLMSGA